METKKNEESKTNNDAIVYNERYFKKLIPLQFEPIELKEQTDTIRKDYTSLQNVRLFTIDNILNSQECEYLINVTNKEGYKSIDFEYDKNYRECERIVCKSEQLSKIIWNRITPLFTRNDIDNILPFGFGQNGIWRPTHINECFRFTKYSNGNQFKSHRDGGYVRNNTNRSVYTLMIYLNHNNFNGGNTIFYDCNNKKDILTLTEKDENECDNVIISPKQGLCVIFNHDSWHKGEKVKCKKNNYKYILRTDIMFECFTDINFNKLKNDPMFIKATYLYNKSVELQNNGNIKGSTEAYLKALSIQVTLPSVPSNNKEYGAEFHWFSTDSYNLIFGYLLYKDVINVCLVSRAWLYHGTSSIIWKRLYEWEFGTDTMEMNKKYERHWNMMDNSHYSSIFRPWKHLFGFRKTLTKNFKVSCILFWLTTIEQGNIDGLANYIPSAVAEYASHGWSAGSGNDNDIIGSYIWDDSLGGGWSHYKSPTWSINNNNKIDFIILSRILTQLVLNKQLSYNIYTFPSYFYDNDKFIQYFKNYTLTNTYFHLKQSLPYSIINLEEIILKNNNLNNGIVILCEFTSFSIVPILNNNRLKNLIKYYISTDYIKIINKRKKNNKKSDSCNIIIKGNISKTKSETDATYKLFVKNIDKIGMEFHEQQLDDKEYQDIYCAHRFFQKDVNDVQNMENMFYSGGGPDTLTYKQLASFGATHLSKKQDYNSVFLMFHLYQLLNNLHKKIDDNFEELNIFVLGAATHWFSDTITEFINIINDNNSNLFKFPIQLKLNIDIMNSSNHSNLILSKRSLGLKCGLEWGSSINGINEFNNSNNENESYEQDLFNNIFMECCENNKKIYNDEYTNIYKTMFLNNINNRNLFNIKKQHFSKLLLDEDGVYISKDVAEELYADICSKLKKERKKAKHPQKHPQKSGKNKKNKDCIVQ